MRIAHGGIGIVYLFFVAQPFAELIGAKLREHILGARYIRRMDIHFRNNGLLKYFAVILYLHIRVAIQGYLCKVIECACAPVLADGVVKQFRVLLNEIHRRPSVCEIFVGDEVFEELDIIFYAADTELAQGAVHLEAGIFKGITGSTHLHQHRVEEGADLHAGIGTALIEPHAEACGIAISDQCAIVRLKVIERIFCSDAALHGKTHLGYLSLVAKAYFRI